MTKEEMELNPGNRFIKEIIPVPIFSGVQTIAGGYSLKCRWLGNQTTALTIHNTYFGIGTGLKENKNILHILIK